MNLNAGPAMQALSFRLLGRVALFCVVGALIGYLEFLGQLEFFSQGKPHLAPLLLVAPCLAAIAALPAWRFKVAETYWKAPLLCAVALISWTILHHYLTIYFFDHIPSNLLSHAMDLWIDGAVRVFAMFAFIMRAMILRTG